MRRSSPSISVATLSLPSITLMSPSLPLLSLLVEEFLDDAGGGSGIPK